MPIAIQGQVGPQYIGGGSSLAAGGTFPNVTARMGYQGDQIFSELHGRYFENTYRGNVFNACNTAAQALTVGLATTYTGLQIVNPPGSTIKAEMLWCGYALSSVQTAQSTIGLAIGTVSTLLYAGLTNTAVASNSSAVGSGIKAQCVANSASATLNPAPLYAESLATVEFGTSVAVNVSPGNTELAGRYVLLPGSYILMVANAVQTGFWSFTWAEVPL